MCRSPTTSCVCPTLTAHVAEQLSKTSLFACSAREDKDGDKGKQRDQRVRNGADKDASVRYHREGYASYRN